MSAETRTCQNCKRGFPITPADLDFYKKLAVPPPTFCPDCRLQRRMMWRNERTLYKRVCAGTQKDIITVYAPDKPFTVYDREYWWGDAWDAMQYGRDYDFSKPFFVQFRELQEAVPRASVNANFVMNSDYCNYVGDVKNCYLCFGSIATEDCLYGSPYESKHCVDSHIVRESEYCYECIDGEKLSRCLMTQDCASSFDLTYCFDCKNCQDCIGCVGLRNKKYCIFNQEYSKEEYMKRREALQTSTRAGLQAIKKEFEALKNTVPHRYATVLQSVNTAGDHIVQSKNATSCFDIKKVEEGKYCMRMMDSKDVQDTNFCEFMELSYEYLGFWKDARIRCSTTCGECTDLSYSDHCYSSSDLFGCVGLRKKQYCIMNKQYSKEEYEALVPKIIEQMRAMPYTDQKGRIHTYGDFFPAELSPFDYNETIAQEYFPLTKEAVQQEGYRWKGPDTKGHTVTMQPQTVPESAAAMPDSIAQEVIGCAHQGTCTHQCTTAFRLVPAEIEFYKRMDVPPPTLCPNCRHYARLKQRNPFKLWERQCRCQKEGATYKNTAAHFHAAEPCPNNFLTAYDPDRPEIVYCEQCYQAEVV